MNKKFKVMIGADPEFFVVEKSTGKIVPSCGRFGGSKKSPIFLCPDGGYLEDGAAVEFNVTPCETLSEVSHKIANLITVFHNQHPGYTISDKCSVKFDKDVMQANPQMNHIGCDADLWAWGLRDLPSIKQFKGWRFAGGHIHVGIDPWPEGLEKKTFIRALDALVLMRHLAFSDPKRYPFYGYPGLFRVTSYGVEWRSPDNVWANPLVTGANPIFHAHFARAITLLKAGINNVAGNLLNNEINMYLEDDGTSSMMTKGIVKKAPHWPKYATDKAGYSLQSWLKGYKSA